VSELDFMHQYYPVKRIHNKPVAAFGKSGSGVGGGGMGATTAADDVAFGELDEERLDKWMKAHVLDAQVWWADGGQMEGRWRADGGQMEGRWRAIIAGSLAPNKRR
jgi:hypothetical protein